MNESKSHIWMSHVPRMNGSCHTYEWVMLHIWMSHVPRINESCHSHEWDMSLTRMRHVAHMNESYHMFESVTSHTWTSHDTYRNVSCPTYEWVMPHAKAKTVSNHVEFHECVFFMPNTFVKCHTCEWACLIHPLHPFNVILMNESRMRHVTRKSNDHHRSHVKCIHDMSYIWISHVPHMNESCHTQKQRSSLHTWNRCMTVTCYIHARVTSHTRTSHVSHTTTPSKRERKPDSSHCGKVHSDNIYMYIYIYLFIYLYIYIHIYTYTYMYIYIYTYIYMLTLLPEQIENQLRVRVEIDTPSQVCVRER